MDYLVNLSLVKPVLELDARMENGGVTIRRALAPEFELATGWVREKFGSGWASETAVAFARQPPSCFLATRAQKLIGFACHESIARGFSDRREWMKRHAARALVMLCFSPVCWI
jgi:hypothetical protein